MVRVCKDISVALSTLRQTLGVPTRLTDAGSRTVRVMALEDGLEILNRRDQPHLATWDEAADFLGFLEGRIVLEPIPAAEYFTALFTELLL